MPSWTAPSTTARKCPLSNNWRRPLASRASPPSAPWMSWRPNPGRASTRQGHPRYLRVRTAAGKSTPGGYAAGNREHGTPYGGGGAGVQETGAARPVREALGLADKDKALHLVRVRSRDGQPFGYYDSWTSGLKKTVGKRDFQKSPRLAIFRKQGMKITHVTQTISAVAATTELAPPSTPVWVRHC